MPNDETHPALPVHPEPGDVQAVVRGIRDQRVILDSDLAALFGVETKRLNEKVKRNERRFGPKYAFTLSQEEFDHLKSQSATSSSGWGGRRSLPRAFTEHGVVMAATVLDSDRAHAVTELIVDVFVRMARRLDGGGNTPAIVGLASGISEKLKRAIDALLDSVVSPQTDATVRDEARDLIAASIENLKERLRKQGLENAEIAARVTKLLAEAEHERARTAHTKAETDRYEFETLLRKLRLVLEAQLAFELGRVDDFLGVLRDMDPERPPRLDR